MMKRQKNAAGITLVALVVTIIVLIILATISINVIFSEGGILERALQGQEAQRMAEAKEKVQLMVADYLVEREISLEEYKLITYMNEQVTKGNLDNAKEETIEGKDKVIVETNGYEIEIDVETLEVTVVGEGETIPEEPEEPEDSTVAVTGIEIKQSNVGIGINDTLELTATIEPSNATNKNVTWTSSDESVVTISDTGVITGMKKGNAIITVTTEDGSKTETCNVVVGTIVTTLTNIQTDTQEAIDRLGNPITIPGGFKVVEGELVQDGIVIEDGNTTTYEDGTVTGNQFVWVPVSNIDGGTDTTKHKMIKVEDETTKEISEIEITLGRYDTFSTTAEPKQLGKDYALDTDSTHIIESYFQELKTAREGVLSTGLDGENATYHTLGSFIESVKENHGYYIARYEASYESGSTYGNETTPTDYKMASKKSVLAIANAENSWSNQQGRLWNSITQQNASKVARNMYNANDEESKYVVSDLVNSYMWDTALIFIIKVEDSNYGNVSDGIGQIRNTGYSGDKKCNIHDMAKNLMEWTTEYSKYQYIYGEDSSFANPNTIRGGGWSTKSYYSRTRLKTQADIYGQTYGFRAGLYVLEK